MSEKKPERVKIYLIIGLSIVLAVVVYFRLLHKKTTHAAAPAQSKPGLTRLTVPQTQLPNLQAAQSAKQAIRESNRAIARDIFRPLKSPPPPEENQLHEESLLMPRAEFKLKGTIVGGGSPIAIINDQFVRTGDWISSFKVVRIGPKEILLDSGHEKIALEMVKNE